MEIKNAPPVIAPLKNQGKICQAWRKLLDRLKQRRNPLFVFRRTRKETSGIPFSDAAHSKNGALPLPVPALYLDTSEKWDWDYYNYEDYKEMQWPNEWGTFEEASCHVPLRSFSNRNFQKNAILVKRTIPERLQTSSYNLHPYPDGDVHHYNSRLGSPLAYRASHHINPSWYHKPCIQNNKQQDFPGVANDDDSDPRNVQFLCHTEKEMKYCKLPDRFQAYKKRYNKPLQQTTSKQNTRENKRKASTCAFIPLKRDSSTIKEGLRFKSSGKSINLYAVKKRHERAQANYNKIIAEHEERIKHKMRLWNLRLKVGLCKRNLQHLQKIEISPVLEDLEKSYHLVYWIGHGQNPSNMVGRFFDMEKNRMVALKIFNHEKPPRNIERLENKLLALAEIKCLMELDHPNVIALFNYFDLDEKTHLVLEPCDHNLRVEIVTSKAGMDVTLAQSIIYQVLSGLNYCHAINILHRDLCPENILVSTTGSIKIADFDKAIFVNEVKGTTLPPGTVTYGAPELLIRDANFGLPSDIWSIGTILCEMICGIPLWDFPTEREQLDKIQRDIGYFFPRHSFQMLKSKFNPAFFHKTLQRLDNEVVSFLIECLRIDPSQRSPCSVLIEHSFMKDVSGKTVAVKDENSPRNVFRDCCRTPIYEEKNTPTEVKGQYCHNQNGSRDNQVSSDDLEECYSDSDGELQILDDEQDDEFAEFGDVIQLDKKGDSFPNLRPYLPYKLTSDKIVEANLKINSRKNKTMIEIIDPVKKAYSTMTVKESMARYNGGKSCMNMTAGGDGEIANKEDESASDNDEDHVNTSSALYPGMRDLTISLAAANWNSVPMFKRQFEALQKSNPVSFKQNVGSFISTLIKQITCTKTTVAGPAIKILSALLKDHGQYFCSEMEKLMGILLQKIGGPYFIEQECCEALHNLIVVASPMKVCMVLTNNAEKKLRNANIRYVASFYLHEAVKNLDIENDIGDCTVAQKKLTTAVFKTVLWLIHDQDPKTRRSAKSILELIMGHSRFWEFYRTFVPESQTAEILKLLKQIRPKTVINRKK